MGQPQLVIKTREADKVVIFDLEGELRRSDLPQTTLHSLVEAQLDRGRRKVLVNLDGVTFVDSFGIGQILASYTSTQNLGGKFKLCGVSKKILLIFQITMIHKVIDIHDECDRAMESFG